MSRIKIADLTPFIDNKEALKPKKALENKIRNELKENLKINYYLCCFESKVEENYQHNYVTFGVSYQSEETLGNTLTKYIIETAGKFNAKYNVKNTELTVITKIN